MVAVAATAVQSRCSGDDDPSRLDSTAAAVESVVVVWLRRDAAAWRACAASQRRKGWRVGPLARHVAQCGRGKPGWALPSLPAACCWWWGAYVSITHVYAYPLHLP